jgi:guanylate kinase
MKHGPETGIQHIGHFASNPETGRSMVGEYHFMSRGGSFSHLIREKAFVEWEEVYPGSILRNPPFSEVERIWKGGKPRGI